MKLIFFDIDGTLISDGSVTIPESAKAAITKARANGHICMINTGRTKCMVGQNLQEQLEFDGYLYGCGTMAVYHGETLFHHSFPVEQSVHIIKGLRKHKVDAVLEGCEDDYCELYEEMHTDFFREYIRCSRGFHFETYAEAPGRFDKFYAYVAQTKNMESFYREFQEQLDLIDRERGFYEVVPKGCSKARGIYHMAEFLGIPMEDTVAIGDSNNDYSMLEIAGIGIAMGNSTQGIIDMADYVTTDVDKDGIWNALKWLKVIS